MVGQLVFWVVGTALFLTIALLPNVLLAWWFYNGGQTHTVVVPTVVLLFVVLWGSSRLLPRS